MIMMLLIILIHLTIMTMVSEEPHARQPAYNPIILYNMIVLIVLLCYLVSYYAMLYSLVNTTKVTCYRIIVLVGCFLLLDVGASGSASTGLCHALLAKCCREVGVLRHVTAYNADSYATHDTPRYYRRRTCIHIHR